MKEETGNYENEPRGLLDGKTLVELEAISVEIPPTLL